MAKTEKEKMLAGEAFMAIDPELTKERLHAKTLLKKFNAHFLFDRENAATLQALLPHAHKSLHIEPPFHCDYGYNVYCGERVFLNAGCVILDCCRVDIGSRVLFGPGVHVYTATHPLDHLERRRSQSSKPVVIGNDCWIGGGAIILPGVTIGHRCVVGAGAVVTRNVPDDSLVAGNPARIIRKLGS
jgi:maltose O-acetyltransferase